jgi:hypothetical protein
MLEIKDIYNLLIGDVITFPFDEDSLIVIEVPGEQFFISCLKNGKPYWFPVVYLRRHLTGFNDERCWDDLERALSALHTTIKVTEILNGFPQFKYVEE